MTDAELRSVYQSIPWDEPQKATLGQDEGYLCRYCVAREGLRGDETHRLGSKQEIEAHIGAEHR